VSGYRIIMIVTIYAGNYNFRYIQIKCGRH